MHLAKHFHDPNKHLVPQRSPGHSPARGKELERLNLEGAKDAAKNAAKSCRAAKDADASATCQDVIEVFKQGRGKERARASLERRGCVRRKPERSRQFWCGWVR